MTDITLPADALPDCGGHQYTPRWRPEFEYPVAPDDTLRAIMIEPSDHYVGIGPYYPGEIYAVTADEADRLESVKGATIAGTVLGAEACDVGGDWALGFILRGILDVGGTVAAYFSADPQYLFEDSAATTPAAIGSPVGAWTSATGAYQATTENKPILRQTPETGIYWLDSNTATSALTATFAESLGSNCTIVRAGPDGVTFLEGQTIGTTYNIAPIYGFNTDVMIVNRALTVPEKALLTRYMGRRVPQLGSEFNNFIDYADMLYYWSLRNCQVTLRRTADGVEADFMTDPSRYLPRNEILAWADGSAVTVAKIKEGQQ